MKPEDAPTRGGRRLDIDEKLDILTAYRNRSVTEEEWLAVRPFVLASLERMDYGDRAVLQGEMLLMTRFASWGWRRGFPLEHEHLLTQEMMEAYFADPTTPKALPSHRWSFNRWGRALTKKAYWPPERNSRFTPRERQKAIQQPISFRPYDPHEVQDLIQLAGRQNTELRSRTALTIVGCCYGGGAQPNEALWAQAADFERLRGTLWFSIGGDNPRRVPIRPRLADAMEDLAATCRTDFLHGRNPYTYRSDSLVSTVHRAQLDQSVRLSGRRLRHTWLLELLNAGVPVHDIYRAAGRIDAPLLREAIQAVAPSSDADFETNIIQALD